MAKLPIYPFPKEVLTLEYSSTIVFAAAEYRRE